MKRRCFSFGVIFLISVLFVRFILRGADLLINDHLEARSIPKMLNETNSVNTASAEETSSLSMEITIGLPFLIGVGLGSTGTHTLFHALCALGIPSVHYNEMCVWPDSSQPWNITDDLKLGLKAHNKAKKLYFQLRQCSLSARNSEFPEKQMPLNLAASQRNCTIDYFQSLQSKLYDEVDIVVSSGIGSIHDTPYPEIWQWLLPRLQSQDKEFGLMATFRNSSTWAVRRSKTHGSTADVVCWDSTSPLLAFDLESCWSLERDPTRLMWGYNLIYASESSGSHDREEFLQFLEQSFHQYQTMVSHHEKLIFSLNLWEGSWNESSVAFAAREALELELLARTSLTTSLNDLVWHIKSSNGEIYPLGHAPSLRIDRTNAEFWDI